MARRGKPSVWSICSDGRDQALRAGTAATCRSRYSYIKLSVRDILSMNCRDERLVRSFISIRACPERKSRTLGR